MIVGNLDDRIGLTNYSLNAGEIEGGICGLIRGVRETLAKVRYIFCIKLIAKKGI